MTATMSDTPILQVRTAVRVRNVAAPPPAPPQTQALIQTYESSPETQPEPAPSIAYLDLLVERYVKAALKHVRTRQLDEGEWAADVVGLDGAWADGDSEEDAVRHFASVLTDWLWLKIDDGDGDIPKLAGIDLNVL